MWCSKATFSVGFNRGDIAKFKSVWPCSGLPDRQVWFVFDSITADLVDTNISDKADGGAQNALVEDARTLLRGGTVTWLPKKEVT